MALTNFVSRVTTISAEWLNKIDTLFVTVFGEAQTKTDARTALDVYSKAETYTQAEVVAIATANSVADQAYADTLVDDLSGVTDAYTATSNIQTDFVVDDAAALRALTLSVGDSGKTVRVVSDDGGIFIAKTGAAPGTYTNNGGLYCGTQVIPTGGDGSTGWVRPESSHISVTMFGADGTDDADAFQLAADLAPVRVYVPSGTTYDIEKPINLTTAHRGLAFFGDAPGELGGTDGTANLKLGFDGVMFDIDGGGVSIQFLGIEFKNLRLDGDAPTRSAGTCVYVHGLARRIYLDHLHIVGFYDYGVNVVSAGAVNLNMCDVFNCGINLRGDTWADSVVYGGQSGSGAGGGATWVQDNIDLLGAGGNTHFINHRPNFSAGIGVRIRENVTRISFQGGLCDHNLGGGFVLEDQCTAIKIQGMDIFDNGETTAKKPGILVNTAQAAFGVGNEAGIIINGNNIFDRDKGGASEVQDVGVEFATGGSITDTVVEGNGLSGCTTPIKDIANLRLKPGIEIANNVGVKTKLSGITSGTIAIDSTGLKTIAGIDVSDLVEDLHGSSIINLTFINPTAGDFAGTLYPLNTTSGTTFDIRANITTASGTGGATVKVAWSVDNQPQS